MATYRFTGKVTRVFCYTKGYKFMFLGDVNKAENNTTWYVAEEDNNSQNLLHIDNFCLFETKKSIGDFIAMSRNEKLTIYFDDGKGKNTKSKKKAISDNEAVPADGSIKHPYTITKAELKYD